MDPKQRRLEAVGTLAIPDGPESLVADARRGRAHTHTWHDSIQAVDLSTHEVVARWKDGCGGVRGIAPDVARGHLFVGCDEGKATCLDLEHDGRLLGSVPTAEDAHCVAADDEGHVFVCDPKHRGLLAIRDEYPACR